MSTYFYGVLDSCFYHVTEAFRANIHPVLTCVSQNVLLETGEISETNMTIAGLAPKQRTIKHKNAQRLNYSFRGIN